MKEQIKEMVRVLDACPFICAPIGCDKHDGSIKIAEYLYNAGYRKQKEGEWELVEKEDFYKFCKCSACGHAHCFGADYELFHFCPNCGSKMKGATDGSKD